MRIRWRGLELPTRVEPDKSVQTETYGRFIVEPFERGFGTTVGNSLRRILLSSLEGAAAISVKIAGVDHEFAQIEGVTEDVTDIILNVKSIIMSMDADVAKTLTVVKKGPCVVTAADLQGDAAVVIHNKNQHIATLTSDVEFNMELEVHKGRGFVTAAENTPEEQIIGVIPIDSIYSPVTRVRYKTEDTRVGQKTNYDRLILEIWTDGTVTPEMALVEAAKILRKHLNAFVQYFEPGDNLDAELPDNTQVATPQMNEELQGKLNQPIGAMELSVRASNCLESAKIHTIGDLVKLTEGDLLKVRSFGKTSLREVKRKLQDLGLSLGMVIGGTEQPAAQ
ncbi:MAG: DNA-directed RNA polymerase subunit alpha [Phycisphaerales bacterium]|nr:DNA-directed RNA polymerase subunit alpha [Phycisphaerales bacterium]